MRRKRSSSALQARLRATTARVERLGAKVFVGPGVPDQILELFLDEIDDCPLCREAAEAADPLRNPRKRPEH
ncbi:MAG: hypothetical protein ABR517_11515 [Thermoanaerobaculia bacterium]